MCVHLGRCSTPLNKKCSGIFEATMSSQCKLAMYLSIVHLCSSYFGSQIYTDYVISCTEEIHTKVCHRWGSSIKEQKCHSRKYEADSL